jgi:hypothetical protein
MWLTLQTKACAIQRNRLPLEGGRLLAARKVSQRGSREELGKARSHGQAGAVRSLSVANIRPRDADRTGHTRPAEVLRPLVSPDVMARTRAIGGHVSAGKERRPAIELDVAARASQILFVVPGRVQTCSEGVELKEHTGQRRGLPDRVRPGESYTDVYAWTRITAWLGDADTSGQS